MAIQSAAWRAPNLRLLASEAVHRGYNAEAGFTDDDHLEATIGWLERAHDATSDGGVSGRYSLREGWTSSYPETTGYIIPTFLALADYTKHERFRDRARTCVDFLESVRLPNGAFPGGEVDENRTEPSVFNTAQIVNGLVAWHAATGEQRAIDMAVGAGDWLVSLLDDDGAWRKNVYRNVPVAYSSHASCWLAQLGVHTGERKFLDGARRHMEWVLSQQDRETGWFDYAGWDERAFTARIAETHTIAYTIWGVLYTAIAVDHPAGIEAARAAANGVARRLELSRTLAGKLDHLWKPRAKYQCLTGNAQMALIWMRLDELQADPRLVNTAFKAIDLVKAGQPMNNAHPGIRGGVPSSYPIWGDYVRFALPNWAAKFFIDALFAKKAALARLDARAASDVSWTPPAVLERPLPPIVATEPSPSRVVLFTRPGARKVVQMIEAWSSWGFKPAAVVIEEPANASVADRLATKVRDEGPVALVRRIPILGGLVPSPKMPVVDVGLAGTNSVAPPSQDIEAYCAARAIPVTRVASLDSPEGLSVIAALHPDLAIHAGAGIMRAATLAIPRIGTLNAHMGILPRYRGMNVAEWARFLGGPVGCSVHFIDAGIDTGDVVCVRRVDVSNAASIAELRAAVDRAQIDLLGDVTRWIVQMGTKPPVYTQHRDEGVQFFRLHADLRAVLQRELHDHRGDASARRGS